jgi:fumarate reductase subunit C
MTPKQEIRLYVLQRLTALILAPLVIIHIGVMIYAVQDGLSTAEMLGRTRSSVLWPVMYSLFFLAAGTHGAIGFRNILLEITSLPQRPVNTLSGGLLFIILLFGFETIRAIT